MDAGAASTEDGADAETATVEELRRGLEELASTVDDRDERRAVRRALRLLEEFPEKAGGIRKCTRRDVAESFVGSILVSLPLLVETASSRSPSTCCRTSAFSRSTSCSCSGRQSACCTPPTSGS